MWTSGNDGGWGVESTQRNPQSEQMRVAGSREVQNLVGRLDSGAAN